jgi:ferredoxin-NADP reductase
VDTRLLVSARGLEDLLYREELSTLDEAEALRIHRTLTRDAPEGWTEWNRRVDAEMLAEVGPGPDEHPRIFICGPTAFVEHVADLLVGTKHQPAAIHAERFGPTGGKDG